MANEKNINQVRALPFLGQYRNEWRQRTVELYRLSPGIVMSIGIPFDGEFVVVAQESDEDHWRALEAFAAGQPYVAK